MCTHAFAQIPFVASFCNACVGLWAHIVPLQSLFVSVFLFCLTRLGCTRSLLAVKQFGSCLLLLCPPPPPLVFSLPPCFSCLFAFASLLLPLVLSSCASALLCLLLFLCFPGVPPFLPRLLSSCASPFLLCCPRVLLPSAAARLSWLSPSLRVWI